MRSTITGLVHHTVMLDSGRYGAAVSVGGTGDIAVSSPGGDGVYLPAGARVGGLINQGSITAGAGAYGAAQGGAGGIGVYFAAFGHVHNAGAIAGGAGSNSGTSGTGGAGGAGIVLAAGGAVHNASHVVGGAGGMGSSFPGDGSGGAGGVGIDLADGGRVVNTGTVQGGAGGYSNGAGGAGGVGISIIAGADAGATLLNRGLIIGGTGGAGYLEPSIGAAGVYLQRGTLSNTGTIMGGTGGYDRFGLIGGTGGAGATFVSDTVSNAGLIEGGTGGGAYSDGGTGGVGVNLLAGSTLENSGHIAGGLAGRNYNSYSGNGGLAVYVAGASTLTNSGTISGGSDIFGGYLAGAGVEITGSSRVINSGMVAGANGARFFGGNAGAGVLAESGSLLNTGAVLGGAGGAGIYLGGSVAGAGGGGVLISAAATVRDTGSIAGGAGGANYDKTAAGLGGVGVSVAGGVLAISSTGKVTGGEGGLSSYAAYAGGLGGAGVSIGAGGRVTNDGTIVGGQGGGAYFGDPSAVGGSGGTGVILNGGTLDDSGTIAGGAGGNGGVADGPAGVAVQFGTLAGTLVIHPSAVFAGAVMANAAATDTLVLAPGMAGTYGFLNGVGTHFSSFANVVEDASARWILGQSNTLGAGTRLDIGGTLTVLSSLIDTGKAVVSGAGSLVVDRSGIAAFSTLTLDGGSLNVVYGGALVVGTDSAAMPGDVTVAQGAAISGHGVITANAVVDDGSLVAQGGTLSLDTFGSVSGGGEVVIRSDSEADYISSSVSVATIFAPGGNETLGIGSSVSGTISGFGSGDVIDLFQIKATSLSFIGGTLSVFSGKTLEQTLHLAGSYTQADFLLGADGVGGTDISFAGQLPGSNAAEVARLGGLADILPLHAGFALRNVAEQAASARLMMPGTLEHLLA